MPPIKDPAGDGKGGGNSGGSSLDTLLDPHIDPSKPPRRPAKKTAGKRTASPPSSGRASRGGSRSGGARDGYLNLAQLEALALKAGATPQEAITLAAIAMAESGGRIGAHNNDASTGDNSYSLWQINMLGAMGPERRPWFGIKNNNELFDPLTNARAAVKLLRSSGYENWSMYNNKGYQDFMPQAQRAIQHAPNVDTSKLHVSTAAYSGGGSVGGGDGSGGDFGTPEPLTVKQYLDDPAVQEKYGYLTAYLHNKEIGPILAKAARNGWGANQLLGALTKTDWWQKKSQSQRAWQAQQRLDPATAQQRLHAQIRTVQTLAQSTLGFRLDDDRAQQIANTSIAQDWSQQDMQHAVGAEFHYHQAKDHLRGAAAQTINTFEQMRQAYLVPLSKKTIGNWTRKVLEGVYQPADFEEYVKQQAMSLYPTLKSALKSGQTVRDYLNPYAELAGQTLEIDPAGIDWFHPKWAKALNTTTPDGDRAPMSLSDWGNYLRSLPDYKHTAGAAAQAASFGLNLAQTFGKVAT